MYTVCQTHFDIKQDLYIGWSAFNTVFPQWLTFAYIINSFHSFLLQIKTEVYDYLGEIHIF